MPTILPPSVLAIAIVLACCAATAAADASTNNITAILTPEMQKILPLPGFYRLEVSTGASSTKCLRLVKNALPESAAFAAPHVCKNLSLKLDANTLTFVDQCSVGRKTSTIRKLSDTTWEYAFDLAQPITLPGDPWGVPELLEALGTPEQREQARQARRIKEERDVQAAAEMARAKAVLNTRLQTAPTARERASVLKVIEAMAAVDARKPVIHTSYSERWTLISSTCGAVKPGAALQR